MAHRSGSGEAMLMALKAVPGAIWRSYLAPEAKVMYMALNKNACTSLKWMMAALAGEDLTTFRAGWQPFISDSESVHNRELWKVSPRLPALTNAQLSELQAGNWFTFAVVRDPRLRLFSAWQNKILIENPISQQWRHEHWYPRHPISHSSVIEDFAAFVELLEREPTHRLRTKDAHFRDQVELLVEDAVPYTRIYEISELSDLREDLAGHLRSQGLSGELNLPRSNPTPLAATAALFDGGVRERVERIYAADFDRFGKVFKNQWDFARVERSTPWSEASIAACETEATLGRRIAEVHGMARRERSKRIEVESQVHELENELMSLRSGERSQKDTRGPLLSRLRALKGPAGAGKRSSPGGTRQ